MKILFSLIASCCISNAFACTTTEAGITGNDETAWAVALIEGANRMPDSCNTAAESVIESLEERPRIVIELIANGRPAGSSALELARLSRLETQFRAALAEKSGKRRFRIESQLLPTLTTNNLDHALGRIILRISSRGK